MSGVIINPYALSESIPSAPLVNATAYDAAVIADAPQLFWKMNEASGTTATDSSGNARHGTYGSAVTVGGTGLFGGADKCPAFLAADDNSVITSSYADNLTTAFTLECLATAELTQSTSGGFMINKMRQVAVDSTDRIVGVASFANPLKFSFAFSDGVDPNVFDTALLSTPVCEQNGKFHVALVYRASGLCEVYVNGVQRASTTIAYTITSNAHNWAFGRAAVINTEPNTTSFKGRAGRVAIYSTALSAAQILAHYNAGITP